MIKLVWRSTLWALLWLIVGGIVGAAFGHGGAGATIAVGLALGRHLFLLLRLHQWLQRPKLSTLPIVGGVWGEIFDALSDMQKRNRRRKKRLAAILAEFQASTEALPDGAVVLGTRGQISWFNPAAQALLGLRPAQDHGLRVTNLVRKPAFTEYFERGDFDGEIEAPSPVNAVATLSYRIIPYGNAQLLLIVRDVSELKRLEIARRDFVSNASHELRTPLTVLAGYLDMIVPEAKTGQPLHEWQGPLQEMRSQVARMENLVADLLKLAKLEAEVLHSRQDLVDVPQLLARQRDSALALSQGRHRIEFDIEPGLRIYGRETDLVSVFANLINNAVHYTPPGGIIKVRWWSDESGAHFAVADTGIGIPEAEIPRITERFYRVDVGRSRASGGTGLGLSIVKHALEHHDARLQIDSELGVGTTFVCHFAPHRVHGAPRVERNSLSAQNTGRES